MGLARREDYLDIVAALPRVFREFLTAAPGHIHVGNQQLRAVIRNLIDQGATRGSITRQADSETPIHENALNGTQSERLIIGDEDGSGSGQSGHFRRHLLW
jgi:hypothetical protein